MQEQVGMGQVGEQPALHARDGGLHVAVGRAAVPAAPEVHAAVVLVAGVVVVAQDEVVHALLRLDLAQPGIELREGLALHGAVHANLPRIALPQGVHRVHVAVQLVQTHAHVGHEVGFVGPCAVVGEAQDLVAAADRLLHVGLLRIRRGVLAAHGVGVIVAQAKIQRTVHGGTSHPQSFIRRYYTPPR